MSSTEGCVVGPGKYCPVRGRAAGVADAAVVAMRLWVGPGWRAAAWAGGVSGTSVDLGTGLVASSVRRGVPAGISTSDGRDTEIPIDVAGGWVEAAAGGGGPGAGTTLKGVRRDAGLMVVLVRAMGAKAGKRERGKGLGSRWWRPKKYPTGTVTFLSAELKKECRGVG